MKYLPILLVLCCGIGALGGGVAVATERTVLIEIATLVT
jgi:hypothetical protein